MKTQNEIAEVLNDLIKINNDRIAGYKKALATIKNLDEDLKLLYTAMREQSKDMIAQLSAEIIKMGSEVATDSTLSGKIYRLWMGVRATFSGHDRKSSLDACEFGEDAAQKAYASILQSNVEISAGVRKLILAQMDALKASHDVIKAHSDAQQLVGITSLTN